MKSKKVYIETFGCQMNADDSSRMAHLLKPLGYENTPLAENADLILINTCSVREKASHKAHSAVGRYYPLKSARPEVILGIAGCQAQIEGKKLLDRFSYLDFTLGPDQIQSLPELVSSLEEKKKRSINQTARIKPADFNFVNLTLNQQESKTSAYVTIMKGCDNFCSFCIVPYVRGREVSRPSNEIINEIKQLVDVGVQEVTLLGQNVNSYGTKRSDELSFVRLLYRIAEETKLKRLRFTTSHPKDANEDLAIAFKEIPQLAKHFHLPVQSGSTAVLQKMYRTYTREEFLKIALKLREVCPTLAISTDFIVGFPGETDADFEDTLSLLTEVGFEFSYSFLYSPRPHTTAGRYFPNDVPQSVKEARLKQLQELQLSVSLAKNQECVGQEYEVLVDGPSKLGETFQGRTSQFRIVHLQNVGEEAVGTFVRAKITRATHTALVGEKID